MSKIYANFWCFFGHNFVISWPILTKLVSIQLKIQFPTTFVSNNFCCDVKLEFLFQALKNTHGRDFNFYVKILHRVYGLQKYIGYASSIFLTKYFFLLSVACEFAWSPSRWICSVTREQLRSLCELF